MSNTDDAVLYWVESIKLAKYYADKHREQKLLHFEVTVYEELCVMLQTYFEMTARQIGSTVEIVKQKLEQQANENDLDSDSNVNAN